MGGEKRVRVREGGYRYGMRTTRRRDRRTSRHRLSDKHTRCIVNTDTGTYRGNRQMDDRFDELTERQDADRDNQQGRQAEKA